jgi:hypothetical protein
MKRKRKCVFSGTSPDPLLPSCSSATTGLQFPRDGGLPDPDLIGSQLHALAAARLGLDLGHLVAVAGQRRRRADIPVAVQEAVDLGSILRYIFGRNLGTNIRFMPYVNLYL